MSVRRITDISLLGTFNATRALADLRRAGASEPPGAEDTRRLQRRRPVVKIRRSELRAVIPALVSLGLHFAVVAAAQRGGLEAPAPSGIAIDAAVLDAVREAYEARRVRHAFDAFRFVEGRWPRDMAELEESGVLGSSPLATGGARPYYYMRREGHALLLARERPAR
jgi:hypothetical protein